MDRTRPNRIYRAPGVRRNVPPTSAMLLGAGVAALTFTALLLAGVAAAQSPAGSEYVEQVPTFSGGGQTTAAPAPKPRPRAQAPVPQAPSPQSQPTVPTTYSAPAQQTTPHKARRKRVRKGTVAHPDLPKVSPTRTSPATSSPDITAGSAAGDTFVWLLVVLAAMTVAIPVTARYARRHGSS